MLKFIIFLRVVTIYVPIHCKGQRDARVCVLQAFDAATNVAFNMASAMIKPLDFIGAV